MKVIETTSPIDDGGNELLEKREKIKEERELQKEIEEATSNTKSDSNKKSAQKIRKGKRILYKRNEETNNFERILSSEFNDSTKIEYLASYEDTEHPPEDYFSYLKYSKNTRSKLIVSN